MGQQERRISCFSLPLPSLSPQPTPIHVPVPAPRGVELDEDILAAVHDLVEVGRGQDHHSRLTGGWRKKGEGMMMSIRPGHDLKKGGGYFSLTCAAVAAAKARMEKSFMLESGGGVPVCVHVVGGWLREHVWGRI